MRKTYKINSISFGLSVAIIIGLSIVGTIPQGSDNQNRKYSLNLNEGDLFMYQIVSFNTILSQEYLGGNITEILGENAQIGFMNGRKVVSKEQIDNIPTIFGNKSGWKCSFLIWDNWTDCFCKNNISNAIPLTLYYLNHIEYVTNNNTDNIEYFFYSGFLTPLSDYMSYLQLSNNFTVESNTIIKEVIVEKQVKYIYAFNSTDGHLSEFSCLTNESETIWCIKRL